MNIWKKCEGEKQIKPLKFVGWRVVEAQHKSTTRSLVDSAEEHEILESLIEKSKPSIKSGKNLHYLLFSPFRYPPLKYGSRFGIAMEPSLWYGSTELKTAFAEVAYYRLAFLRDTEANLGYIHVLLTAYSVKIKTSNGILLDKNPFDKYRSAISSPQEYSKSQQLGSKMREANVLAFTYFSARTSHDGINIGAFSPEVFATTEPNPEMQTWKCIADKQSVEFIKEGTPAFHREVFPIDLFRIKGKVPRPAAA